MKIGERPNALIISATAALALTVLARSTPIESYALSATFIGFGAWGYDELRHGSNWVRRLMGVIVMVVVIFGLATYLNYSIT